MCALVESIGLWYDTITRSLTNNSKVMSENTLNSKRIAKNTIMLYTRMIIVMVVGLFTSRIVLQALGIEDFGLYNVVGGVVSLFAFLRTSMEKCTQRFLNVEMTKLDGKLRETFSVALIIHVAIAAIALILLETVGLWFLNAYINIPEGREFAANCVFQSVVGGLVLTILTIPYSAEIIAHERMGIFALISVIDCLLKLGAAFIILYSSNDHLILYGLWTLFVHIINFLCYYIFCRKKFKEAKLLVVKNKNMYKEMLSYTTWALLGHAMILGTNQGNSILVNMFHGVSANAAMAVANQVNNQVLHLTGNFQTAFNPQITKAYAAKDYSYLKTLIYSTSKISFYLLTIVSLPLFFNIDFVLNLWLKDVPAYSSEFCILMLISGILQSTSAPLNFCVMATGKIKWFQICTGIVFLSDLFILYVLFGMGLPPTTAMWVKVGIMSVVVFVRLYFAQKVTNAISFSSYLKTVWLPIIITSIINVAIWMYGISICKSNNQILYASLVCTVLSCVTVYLGGLSTSEKNLVSQLLKKIFRK